MGSGNNREWLFPSTMAQSHSDDQKTIRDLCLEGMGDLGLCVEHLKGLSSKELMEVANLAAYAAGGGKVFLPSKVLEVEVAKKRQALEKLRQGAGGMETDPEWCEGQVEEFLVFLQSLRNGDLMSPKVYPLLCQLMEWDPNGTFRLLKGLPEHPHMKALVEIAALAYKNSILAVPPELGRHLTSELVTKVVRKFPQLRFLKDKWLNDDVVRASLTCNMSLALQGMRAEQVHALKEKFGNIINEMESECVQDRKRPCLVDVVDTAPEYQH